MLIYLLIYIPFILCAWYDFDGKTGTKKKDQILWFWVIVFTLFRGLRWDTGTDWDQFLEVYNHAHWNNIFSYVRYGEQTMDYGYMFLNAVFNESGMPYTAFLLASNFWIMWCYKDFCMRHTAYPILSLIFFLNIGVPFPVRQTIAMATSLFGYRFAAEKKWFSFFIIAVVATLIHKGSLICFLVLLIPYLLDRFTIKWWMYAGLYLSTFIVTRVIGDYIRDIAFLISATNENLAAYGDNYLNMEETSVDFGDYSASMLNGLSYTLFFGILLYLKEKCSEGVKQRIKYSEIYFLMYALATSIDNLIRQSVSDGMTEILGRTIRTIDMTSLFMPLMFTMFLTKYIKNKTVIFLSFSIYMCYKFWLQIPGSFFSDLFIPYKSIFDV